MSGGIQPRKMVRIRIDRAKRWRGKERLKEEGYFAFDSVDLEETV